MRDEIKSHAKALNCMYIVGLTFIFCVLCIRYEETTTIHDELFVLMAVGTAVNLDPQILLDNDESKSYSSTIQSFYSLETANLVI